MSSSPRTPPASGAFARRFTSFTGLYFDQFEANSAWIREEATVHLPPLAGVQSLLIRGEMRAHPECRGLEIPPPGLRLAVNGTPAATLASPAPGPWQLRVALPAAENVAIQFTLAGVRWTNLLAWLGRTTGLGGWQRFRRQNKNRQLRITTIETDAGEVIFDFSRRDAPYSSEYARRHAKLGLNVVGFITAELGVGESARCMVRATDAAGIPCAVVPLKLHCKNRMGDQTYAARLQDENPHGVNVVHIDPPAARDIDHHHGKGFRAGKYNIAYFAWELPEFPDAWVPSFDYFDEIWCPSDFTSSAIMMKSPLPVLTMPHAIDFPLPGETVAELRARFGLPAAHYLFLTLFDLNSYAARKNPQAAIEAFRRSGLAGRGAALVLKVQNVMGNEADFAALQAAVRDLPGTILLTGTLARSEIYGLEKACDCFVSLHRSEGFGLAVAESMFLGLPVISTDWAATAEFVDRDNGCPVRAKLVTLQQSHGPYAKGSIWAEPDAAHAAEHMRALFADRSLGPRLGAAARVTIVARFAPAVVGTRYRRRLESIATF